jgi:hypothetical protein
MPRFYQHLRDGMDEALDPEGHDYADSEALRAAVIKSARDVICGEITSSGTLQELTNVSRSTASCH